MDTRRKALETVREWRGEIERAVGAGASSPLAGVLSREDTGHAYLVKVLDVHPCLGKVAGRRLLDELGIAHQTRLSALTSSQVDAIGRHCRCDRG